MPASLKVGASMPSIRSSPLVASTRMSPLAIWSLNSPAPEVAKSTLSPRMRRQQVAAAVVRHEVDLLGVDADGLGELHRQQVVRAAGRGAAADADRALGSAFHALTRSSMVLNGESFGTMTAPYSSISRTIGVVSLSVASDLLV